MVRFKRPYHCGKTQHQNSGATSSYFYVRSITFSGIYNADKNKAQRRPDLGSCPIQSKYVMRIRIVN